MVRDSTTERERIRAGIGFDLFALRLSSILPGFRWPVKSQRPRTFDESNLTRAATTNPSADKMDLRRPAVLREVDQITVGVRDTVLRLSIRRPLLDLRRRSEFFAKWFLLLDVFDFDAELVVPFLVVRLLLND